VRILTVSIVLRIVFSIACHCSCAGGFSLVPARPYIVIGVDFPLQIDCILLGGSERADVGSSRREADAAVAATASPETTQAARCIR